MFEAASSHQKEAEVENPFFESLREKDLLSNLTNFEGFEILQLFGICQPFMTSKKRGPKSTISAMDGLVALLIILKTGKNYETLAKEYLSVSPSVLWNAVDKTIEPLVNSLKSKWWKERPRPTPLRQREIEDAALLIDSTSIEINRPSGKFKDGISFYDEKNHCYAIKKEVAVMSSFPFYALFSWVHWKVP